MTRTVFITGGASGIGAACGELLAAHGWNVVVADRDTAAAQAHAAGLGEAAWAVSVDVTDESSMQAAIEATVERFGGLNSIITSAGIIDPGDSADVSPERWRRLLAVNLDGTFSAARQAFPHLARTSAETGTDSTIVMISSIAAHIGIARRASYAASKGGVEALVRTLANEWSSDGIRVNGVAPGYIRTELVESAIRAGTVDLEKLERNIPRGRLGTPRELAQVVAFLAGEESSFVTGQTIIADGGMTVGSATW